ncbi:sulfur oxidation c-type cytochrome SoxX [Roseinatronobacter bogoriensis]|uniref:Sulfur oxidation c-type cytochrome SoxX n=1 Tax=Roseinatronobacter bogoriensis subsp. barguzinensis TaxID=441209 RepID=A0A2K8K734_9RHOB|nr:MULTISPECIES: sulfur oxidation c-type cytochrome SoxX [Rhodobaca]ATX65272.1 sulfur oxidation c-type cytochrome SoxX [Rhodobaca barguzinensis]MBB4209382.1 sulfur-oxidizing protein SoxX [Rhodobaca bogoriensis DSM 18756]TDW34557.1 monoheme cytochrome SoxX (sulfur oxidation) [Rhodobaca barguzinensis]TDY67124.1 monoheme cytochrome SoxX (sulfur oxidation) [Rhodobaca bogoriensis DSM 18756]
MTRRSLSAAFAATAVIWGGASYADISPADIVWEDEIAIPASLTGTPGDPAAGAEAFSSRSIGNCLSCHVNSDMPEHDFQGDIGPPVDGAGARWSEAELRGIVSDAKRMFPDSMMPTFYNDNPDDYIRPGEAYTARAYNPETFSTLLTAQQVEDVVAYLMTLTDW